MFCVLASEQNLSSDTKQKVRQEARTVDRERRNSWGQCWYHSTCWLQISNEDWYFVYTRCNDM